MRSRVMWALVLVSLLGAWPAMAQEQSGSIQGVVKDSSGGVLPGVTVEARSPSVVGVSTAVTDEKGQYRFPALPPGTYTVTADLSGFTPAKVANANLALGQLLTVDLTLSVGALQENVQVTAEAPLIDTKQNASFSTVSKDVIERIPKGRDFTDVIQTAPGAQAEAKSGGTQIDGASGSENRYIIDGMDTTNMQNGTSGKTMLVDFIQEVQVKSSGYNAEFGGATGGVVSAITKSGSNDLRGSLGTYYNSDKFYGDQRAWHSYSPWNSNLPEEGLVDTVTPYLYLSPVADLGGPILKDKMWFYGGFAFTTNRYERDAIFDKDPTLTKRHFEWNTKAYYPNYNITTQLNNNMRLRISGSNQRNFDRGTAPTLQPENRTYLGTATPGTLSALYGKPTKGLTTATFDTKNGVFDEEAFNRRYAWYENDSTNDVLSANFDWVITPRFYINTTTGYFRTNEWTGERQRGNELRHVFSGSPSDATMIKNGFPTIPVAYQQANAYSDKLSSQGTIRNIYDRFYFNANGIYYKSFAGQHVIKAGTRYERFGNDIYRGNAFPVVTMFFGQAYSTTSGDVVAGKYGYYQVNKTGTIGKVHSNNYSFWLQDSWSVNNKLTVNAGVRVENELIPSYKDTPDAIDIKFGFGDKIAPRLGFAYDIKGDGKWKAYGSYGWFYDITKLSLPRGAFGGDHWINYYWTLDTYDWASLNCDEGTTGCQGKFIEEVDMRHSSNQPDPDLAAYFNKPGMTGIEPNLKPVQTGEFTLGLDRELNSTMSLGVRYVHKWLTRTIEDVGVSIPDVGEIYIIGNPGFGVTEIMEPEYPEYKTPKAKRNYDSVEMRLRRRFANRWSGEVSYTWSRLYGNYGGLASSDEPNASGQGRLDPNVNRYFDSLLMSYDRNNDEVEGLLATDRPHVVKVQGTYDLPWGTQLGAYGIIQSGLPQTSQMNWNGYPVYYNGRGDMGRLPSYKNLDLQVSHEFRLGRQRIALLANVSNVFDTQSVAGYYTTQRWRDRINPGLDVFYGGPWDPQQLVDAARANKATVRDADWYGVPDLFQGYRQIRFQAKYSF